MYLLISFVAWVVPSRQVGSPAPPSIVTATVADDDVTALAVMPTPPAGSLNVWWRTLNPDPTYGRSQK